MDAISHGREIEIMVVFYQSADSTSKRLKFGGTDEIRYLGSDDEVNSVTIPSTADSESYIQVVVRDSGDYYYSKKFYCKVRKVDSDFMEGRGNLTIVLPAKGEDKDVNDVNFTALENTMQIAAYNNKCKVSDWSGYDLNNDGKEDVYANEEYAPDLEQYVRTESDAVDVGAVTKTIKITEGMPFNRIIGIDSANPSYKLEYYNTVTFKFPRRSVKGGKVTVKSTSLVYTGKYRKPTINAVKVKGKTLKAGTDYTVSGSRKAIGPGKITITGKGKYTGTLTKTFTVKPGKVTIKSTAGGAKKLTVKWGKKSGGVKYQIKYRVKGTSTWKNAYTSNTYKTIKNLKAGKTYQVKVRAYKKVNGKTYYGKFSEIKSVKVK